VTCYGASLHTPQAHAAAPDNGAVVANWLHPLLHAPGRIVFLIGLRSPQVTAPATVLIHDFINRRHEAMAFDTAAHNRGEAVVNGENLC
jgi:hypothetical protein